jgi:hypothetical protein
VAEGLLDGLDIVGDGYEDIEAGMTVALATIDATAVEMDATLDTILALLALDPGTDPVNQSFGTWAADGDGIDSFVDQANAITVPALQPVPLVDPGGQGTVTFGGSPATGGVPSAGSAAYTLQVQLPRAGAYLGSPTGAQLAGPNPPFTGIQGFQQVPAAGGGTTWVALIGINPAADGNFTATLTYSVVVSITGIQGVLNVSMPINVVVSG